MTVAARVCCALLAAATVLPAAAAAQETREAIIAEAQAAKARELRPYVPSKAERIAGDLKGRLLDTPEGWYPWFDSVYSGGGLTGGAGYRRFVGDQSFVDARGLFSTKAYKLVEVATGSFGPSRPLEVRAAGGWRDATQVAFYGVGGDTAPEAKANFQMQQAYAGVNGRLRGPARTFADLGFRFENYTLRDGNGSSSPSIELIYTAETAPGLGANPTYLRTTIAGGVDTRHPSPGYARRGGLYAVTYDVSADQDEGTYSFDILQAEIVQHVPVLRDNWVLSFHGVTKTTLDDDDTVPYFLLPALGSGSTLRAYPSWRFRDRHSLLMSGEFRWMPAQLMLDVALFYDTGKVASRREDLNFEQLQHNWGLGFRFHGPLATPLRIEFAHGREGLNIVFSGAAAF